jgi:hypothetical protein
MAVALEHKRGRVEYSACVNFLDARVVVLCKPGRTNSHWKRRATGRAAARLRAAPFAALQRGPEPLAHC